ncbi:MAG TPA: glycosyltransferase family 9 protein [Terriglobia bacterium]|nr:glycosyltransferase family 9 protein [Terriglobia bacterium]
MDASGQSPRILVIRAGAIGDTLMTTPLVRALRQRFPDGSLSFLCSRAAHDVLRHNLHLDRVIPLTYRHLPAWLSREKLRLARELCRLDLDWALVLESHSSFLELARRSGARRVVAYGEPAGHSLPQGFQLAYFDPEKHSIENHLRAAAPLGVEPSGPQSLEPQERAMELYYPAVLDAAVRERLAGAGVADGDLLVGIHAGWGGESRRGSRRQALEDTRLRSWPPGRFAEVARWLAEQAGARIVLTGAAADQPLTEFIAQQSKMACLNFAGKLSLLELAALIRRLDVYLTVDSGPAHMAAALGTPLVTLWGPGILEQTRPLAGRGPVRLLYKRVHCAPCYGTPLVKSCQDNICMKQIEVAEVVEAVGNMLAGTQASRAGRTSRASEAGASESIRARS